MGRIAKGFSFALKGAAFLLGHSRLWGIALLPVVLNILLFIGGTWTYFHYFSDLLGAIMQRPEIWYMWIPYVLIIVLLVVVFALAVIFGFTAIGCIVASPFLDLLSEKVERIQGRPDDGGGLRQAIADMGRGMLASLLTIGMFVATQAVLLILWLLPVVGQIVYMVMATLVGSFFLAREFFDFPLGRRHINAKERFGYMGKHLPEALGFGFAVFLTTLVPLLNFLLLPAATTGATLLVRHLEEGKSNENDAG